MPSKAYASLILLFLILASCLLSFWTIAADFASLMEGHRRSEEMLHRETHRTLNQMLEEKKGIPYEDWTDRERFCHERLRILLAEQGEYIPERPATDRR